MSSVHRQYIDPVKTLRITPFLEKIGIPTWIEELSDEVVLVRMNGGYRCYSTICPHNGGPLHAQEPGQLRCGWHDWVFDLDGGHCMNRKAGVRLKSYEVLEEGGELWLKDTGS